MLTNCALVVCMESAVISGSKVKILKVNHNTPVISCSAAKAVISGSKVKILKVNHNLSSCFARSLKAVISGSKVKILKVNHNSIEKSGFFVELLSLAQR